MAGGDVFGDLLTVTGTRTFLGAPQVDDLDNLDVDLALFGVPYDFGTSIPLRTGQSRGPLAVRAEALAYWADVTTIDWVDPDTGETPLQGYRFADVGDVFISGGQIMPNLERMTTVAEKIAASGAVVGAIGGDHSISFPVGRGTCEKYEMVDIVHFDAHADFADMQGGSKYTHGSNLRRLSELPFIGHITALGIRNTVKSQRDDLLTYGGTMTSVRKARRQGIVETVNQTVPPAKYIYVSIDSDVLDAALVPGTTMPEPGGFTYDELIEALAAVAKKGRIVGFDIVEMNAPHDINGLTARTINWVMFEFLRAIAENER